MSQTLDTSLLPSADRAEIVREIIAANVVHVDIEFPGLGGPPAATRGVISDLGQVRVCTVHSNATRVERTAQLARDSQEPTIFLGVQMSGSSLVVQDGREAILRPGELVFSDSSQPYTLLDTDGIRQHFFAIPIAALALPHGAVRQLRAVTLSPGHPVADLAATYFRRLGTRPDIYDQPAAQAVGQPSVELVRALISTHLDLTRSGRESLHATLLLRILEYARAHLADPHLSATQIASEHHISVRHLYNVLAEGDIALGDWIRTQRLESCRADLTRPPWRDATIASIARRHGFTDASTFGRLFKADYGVSPREWRRSHQQ